MIHGEDWRWKIHEAIEERLKKRYDFIGSKSAAPFLAITYPHQAELAFLKEWQTHIDTLKGEFDTRCIDCLEITSRVINDLGVENIVESYNDPMVGSDPQADLGKMFIDAIVAEIEKINSDIHKGKLLISIEKTAALHSATDPGILLNRLWNSKSGTIKCPIIILIPGTNKGNHSFSFLDRQDIFMYRGDLL